MTRQIKMQLNSKLKGAALFLLLLIVSVISSSPGCKENDPVIPPDDDDTITDIGKARVWLTSGDQANLLNYAGELSILETAIGNLPVIQVDTSQRFQSIEGFGAALTGSSAYLLNQRMTAGLKAQTLKDLFDPVAGIGISYLRLTMGASDFSLSDFTYDDIPAGQTDFELEQFSLAQDLEDVVPVLKDILQIAPDIELMGTPWSPPAWMKTNGSLKGGKLKTDCYNILARYFVKYIQEMDKEGIRITAVTPQNEPLYFTASYPCMQMQAAEQLQFVRDHLGPSFVAVGLNTKIIIYDHNWDVTEYAISILNDATARQFIAGSAFHAYAGSVTAMSTVHSAHPDKGLYFTEISGGAWATDFSDNLMWNMRNIFIGTMQNWSKNALLWNLVLDQHYGPQNNGCDNCRGVVTYNTDTYNVIFNEEYYSIAHFSKFVRPGAVRLGSIVSQDLNNVGVVAFQNIDGTKAMVVCNYGSDMKIFTVKQGKRNFNYSIPGFAVTTIVW